MAAKVTTRTRAIARPLKVLIPLIQSEIQQGDTAGREHYRHAGEMLIEAKDQVPYGGWGKWLSKNFDLTSRTASTYMLWAKHAAQVGSGVSEPFRSLRHMTGQTERRRDERQSKVNQEFRRVLRDVARDDFLQERQKQDAEIKLRRDLAEELIEAGYRALAMRLHPDRGGSKDAMTRLTDIRDELKSIAQQRRFI